MLAGVDECALALGVTAPEDEDDPFAVGIESRDGLVREGLPATFLMGSGAAALDRKRGVQQQHTLLGPMRQAAVVGRRDAQVALQFAVDIGQRRRNRHAGWHRETQAVGLARAVVGILPQNHHLDGFEGRGVVSGEPVVGGGIDDLAGALFGQQKGAQFRHIGQCELGLQPAQPGRVQLDRTRRVRHPVQPSRSGRIWGNSKTSRIDAESVSSMTRRSIPIPSPAVGGRPYSRARM